MTPALDQRAAFNMKAVAVLSLALEPRTDDDQRKLANGLQSLIAEDSALRVTTDPSSSATIIRGVGERHLEIILDRLRREHGVEALVGKLQAAYKETITRRADAEITYDEPRGGRRHFGHVRIRLHPADSGAGYAFHNAARPGVFPQPFVAAIDEGIREALAHGVVAGYPVDDVTVELCDGSHHAADSSEAAFRIAGALAFREAMRNAEPVLLEPIMRVEVTLPREFAGDVHDGLMKRRGHVQSQAERGETAIVVAWVPLSAMLGYATDLGSRTRGRGTFVMTLAHYRRLPPADEHGDGSRSAVRAPLTPSPVGRESRVALPEPTGDVTTE